VGATGGFYRSPAQSAPARPVQLKAAAAEKSVAKDSGKAPASRGPTLAKGGESAARPAVLTARDRLSSFMTQSNAAAAPSQDDWTEF
jgi:hypothetical protein